MGSLEMLGLLWINEQQPAAADLLRQGFGLLHSAVMVANDHDYNYNEEVMGTVRLCAQAGLEDGQKAWLLERLDGMLRERPTSLELTDALLDGEEEEELRAVVQRLEERQLRALITTEAPGNVPVRRARLTPVPRRP